MPAFKVSELASASTMNDTDSLYLIHGSADAQITGAVLSNSVVGSSDIRSGLTAANTPSATNPFVTRSKLLFTNADDYATLALAITATPSGGILRLAQNTNYNITDGNFIRRPISIVGGGRTTRVVLTAGGTVTCSTAFWFQSAMDSNSASLPYYNAVSTPTYYRTFSGTLSGGESSFTLASVTGLSVGLNCMLLLGVDTYDATQPYLRMWNKVSAINGSVVTFTLPVPEAINGTNHKCITFDALVENVRLSDLTIAYDGTFAQDQSVWFDKCRNVICENIYIERATNGLIAEACENISIRDLFAEHIEVGGLLVGFGNTNGHAQNIGVLDSKSVALSFETQNRGFVVDTAMLGRGPTATTGDYTISALGHSTGIVLKNSTLMGVGSISTAFHAINIGQGSQVVTENFYLKNGVRDFQLSQHRGLLEWAGVMYSRLKHYSMKYVIAAGTNNVQLPLPKGRYKLLHIWIDSITSLGIINYMPIGTDLAPLLVANTTIDIGSVATILADVSEYNNISDTKYLLFFSPLYAGGNMHIEIEYWPSAVDDSSLALLQN